MPQYTQLHGVPTTDGVLLIEQLQDNLLEFFNYGLLEAGGFTDVAFDPTDVTNDSVMSPVHMPGQPDGRVWQAKNRNWVWEGGLESSRQPVAISGVYVNNTFIAAASSGIYKHILNYPEGRVVFDSPLPITSIVQAEYSYRWVNFYDQSVPWFRDVIFDAYRYEVGPDALPSGVIGLLSKHSVQLPAVIVETVATRRMVPKQLGDLSQWVYQDFLFHILSEVVEDRDFIIDAVTLQKDKTIYLFDKNARAAAGAFPLDWHGSKIVGAKTYLQLVEPSPTGFRWKKCIFNKMVGQDTSARLPLFRGIVRVTLEVDNT
jgi:hypothetical protein